MVPGTRKRSQSPPAGRTPRAIAGTVVAVVALMAVALRELDVYKRQVPFYDYDESRFFCSDEAPADVAARRRAGFERLSALYKTRFAETIRRTAETAESISDLQFTDAYRVPFQYSRYVRTHLPSAAFMQSSAGVTVTDLDGNTFYDVSGSYGVNVLGYDFYKGAIERGASRVRELGPVLGPYHPLIIENVKLLKEISGLDEVSFHMSGTEAVMQAVRLARYHCLLYTSRCV